jgi:hypothetical protein
MTVVIKMPGFTAENAIFKTKTRSRFVHNFNCKSNSAYVQPALPNLCDVLHDMSWNAYYEGNYGLVEIVNAMMEGAGCFR